MTLSPNSPTPDVYQLAVVPDIHVPFHDWRSLNAVQQYLSKHWWDCFLCVGDFSDLDILSRFVYGKPRLIERRTLNQDYDIARRVWGGLLRAVKNVNPNCETIMLEGNHEARIKRLYDEYPQLQGLLDVKKNLQLEETGTLWVDSDSEGKVLRFEYGDFGVRKRVYDQKDHIRRVDGVSFIHGWYHNMHHAKKTVEAFGHGPIYYGHTHDLQTYTSTKWGPKKVEGGSLGNLCLPQGYTQGRPTRWQQAFGVFRLHKTGYDRHFVRLQDHCFLAPDGLHYSPILK